MTRDFGNATDDVTLSIVVPCHNAALTVSRCLDSLICQTMRGVRVICVDDGSTDDTAAVLDTYQLEHPQIISVVHTENHGVWRARRIGIAKASSKFIGFVDSDDYVSPSYAQEMIDALLDTGADIAICGYERIDSSSGRTLSVEMCAERGSFLVNQDPGRVIEVNTAVWNKVFRASLLRDMPDLSRPPLIAEDFLFCSMAYQSSRNPVVFVARPLVHYLVHGESAMTTISAQAANDALSAMAETRSSLEKGSATHDFLEAFDTAVFLHAGISINHRLSYDTSINLKRAVNNTKANLDRDFPLWRSSRYTSLGYAFAHGRSYLLLHLAANAMKHGYLHHALRAYKALIDRLHLEIKW